MRAPELRGIRVGNERRDILLDLRVKARELAIEIIEEQVDHNDISAKFLMDEELFLIPICFIQTGQQIFRCY